MMSAAPRAILHIDPAGELVIHLWGVWFRMSRYVEPLTSLLTILCGADWMAQYEFRRSDYQRLSDPLMDRELSVAFAEADAEAFIDALYVRAGVMLQLTPKIHTTGSAACCQLRYDDQGRRWELTLPFAADLQQRMKQIATWSVKMQVPLRGGHVLLHRALAEVAQQQDDR